VTEILSALLLKCYLQKCFLSGEQVSCSLVWQQHHVVVATSVPPEQQRTQLSGFTADNQVI